MGRKILYVTTDQQRYDALGCNGGAIARTPVIDRLAAEGVTYDRAHNQNVVCMPARATMITGQHVRTHGVWMNGVPLPADAPSVVRELNERAGYRTGMFGKAHWEPYLDPTGQFYENQMGLRGEHGPHRGFEHLELATHTPLGAMHWAQWMMREHADEIPGFYPVLTAKLDVNAEGGGDTGAVQVKHNPVPRDHYHTDWVADRAIAWLEGLDADDDWFCWVSFPDPHHPWDPPASELGRVSWRDLDLPAGYPATDAERRRILEQKPYGWLHYYDGRDVSNMEVPAGFAPASLTADQIREIDALTHIENELIDEACGRVVDAIAARGWLDDTDVLFTTDHGELQGDFGLLFKGPYHVDALMRVPLVWRPAPSSIEAGGTSGGSSGERVSRPVGHLDLAPTFCAIAGIPVPEWMEGEPLPVTDAEADAQGRDAVLTEWDSEFNGIEVRLRSIYRDGWLATAYLPGTWYEGTEGELYDLTDDPQQRVNRWDDPTCRSRRDDLVDDLRRRLGPEPAERPECVARV
jgi:arylsulfatase A-like enzyme